MTGGPANGQMCQVWATGAEGWVAHERIFDAVMAPFTTAVVAAVDPRPGRRVLDVGCGSGTLLAAAVERGAEAVGVDISPVMTSAAGKRVPDATVVTDDAQTADLLAAAPGEPFDAVMSRFGVMFFDDPVAAFANIRAATRPGAGLTFVCWRGPEENQMFTLGTSILSARLDPPRQPPVAGQPGPVAFADPVRTESILRGAGWTDIAMAALDGECDYGIDGTDGVDARLAMILATTTGRAAREQLEPQLGAEGWDSLLDEVRAELRHQRVDGVVRFTGATWLVTATNAG